MSNVRTRTQEKEQQLREFRLAALTWPARFCDAARAWGVSGNTANAYLLKLKRQGDVDRKAGWYFLPGQEPPDTPAPSVRPKRPKRSRPPASPRPRVYPKYLSDLPLPITITQAAVHWKTSEGAAAQRLSRMVRAGVLFRIRLGTYTAASVT